MSSILVPHGLRPEQLIGTGRTAQVYLWNPGTVLKLYHPSVKRSEIEAEARAGRAAQELGLRAPRVGELIEVQGTLGLVFERAAGISMLDLLFTRPSKASGHTRKLAELQAEIHSYQAPVQMPDQALLLQIKIQRADLPSDLRNRISRLAADLPSDPHLCHGDFHSGNVMLDGERVTQSSTGMKLAAAARS
jgi:Ser/Thr protein kinase RdoA (MazF antagonist)